MGRQTLTELDRRYTPTLVYMLTGGLEYLVEESGGLCLGISLRSNIADSLLVIRAEFEGKRMVAFVSALTAAGTVCKAHTELRNGGLRWRPDKYAK